MIVLLLVQCSSGSSQCPAMMPLTACRPMTVKNNSSEDIWLGMVSSAQTCTTDADCCPGVCVGTSIPAPPGSNLNHFAPGATCQCPSNQCNALADCNVNNHKCFLKLPTISNPAQPPNKQAFLSEGSSVQLCIPTGGTGSTQWSGRFFARKGCDANGQNCLSANCTANAGSCPHADCGPGYSSSAYAADCPNNGTCAPQNGNCLVGTGGSPPATSAEFTLRKRALSAGNVDFYDVSMIDGVNMAISIQPDATGVTDPNLPYQCTSPGKDCSWSLAPTPSSIFQQVGLLNNPTPCTSDSDCNGIPGAVCGLALNVVQGQKFSNVCGPLEGYWSASQICDNLPAAPDGSPVAALKCYQSVGGQPMTDLFRCTSTAAASCYRTGGTPNANCCGCPTVSGSSSGWPSLDPAQANIQCRVSNPNLVTGVQPLLKPF